MDGFRRHADATDPDALAEAEVGGGNLAKLSPKPKHGRKSKQASGAVALVGALFRRPQTFSAAPSIGTRARFRRGFFQHGFQLVEVFVDLSFIQAFGYAVYDLGGVGGDFCVELAFGYGQESFFSCFVSYVVEFPAGVVAGDFEEVFELHDEFSSGVLCVDVEDAAHLGDPNVNSSIKT